MVVVPPSAPDASLDALCEHQIEQLQRQGYTRSLAQSLNKTKESLAIRIWIVDSSGSMHQGDGSRLVSARPNSPAAGVRLLACSRWEEIRECVEYHIRLAALTKAPTRFRFLNPPNCVGVSVAQQFSICDGGHGGQAEVQEAIDIIRRVRPGGCTPLTHHVLEVHGEVTVRAETLRRSGQRVALILATDGLPTDERGQTGDMEQQEFVESLRLLQGLPVWLVIRLCTDEEAVVNFYNHVDAALELDMDIIDDFCGEAAGVYAENPWLNYALPLHRMREMGYHDRLFDLIDERPLSAFEIRDFCALLLGEEQFDGAPDPAADAARFCKHIAQLLAQDDNRQLQWNPVTKRAAPWIDTKRLHRALCGRRGGTFLASPFSPLENLPLVGVVVVAALAILISWLFQ